MPRKGSKAPPKDASLVEDEFVAPASTKAMGSSAKEKELRAQIKELQAKLGITEEALSEAQKSALEMAESQSSLMQREVTEVPSGKTKEIPKLVRYKVVGHKDDGSDILRPVFTKEKVPTYFYKIDMAPCGGLDLKLNGAQFFHGAVYEVDIHQLRSLKDIVYRTWKHDRDIHGTDENFYRKQDPNWQARNAAVMRR